MNDTPWNHLVASARWPGASIAISRAGWCPVSMVSSRRPAIIAARTCLRSAPTCAAVKPVTAATLGRVMPAAPFG